MNTCDECGMPVEVVEYHPYAACLMFKACHDSKVVNANLKAVFDAGKIEGLKAVKERADCRRIEFREDIAEALDRMICELKDTK